MSHFYSESHRCVRYDNLPQPYCFLENDPDNPCCQRPKCVFPVNYITNVGEITTPIPKTGSNLQMFFFKSTSIKYDIDWKNHVLKKIKHIIWYRYSMIINKLTFNVIDYCEYHGQHYQQGQSWYDGCSYKCTCENALEGKYRCIERWGILRCCDTWKWMLQRFVICWFFL